MYVYMMMYVCVHDVCSYVCIHGLQTHVCISMYALAVSRLLIGCGVEVVQCSCNNKSFFVSEMFVFVVSQSMIDSCTMLLYTQERDLVLEL